MEKRSYVGRIQNAGAQKVNAPLTDKGRKNNGKVKTGGDLRESK